MIQDLRENLKGTVAVVFVAFVLVAMVITGQELTRTSLSDSVASVNGDDISKRDLNRAMILEKQRLKSQFGLKDDAEELKDEKLQRPAMESLIRDRVVVQAAQRAGMGVSEVVVKDQIKQNFTQDNQFNQAAFNNYLSNLGFTQATYLQKESERYISRQLLKGLYDSAFLTQKELDLLAAIIGQKRTFSAVTIPAEKAAKVVPADDEINQYFKDNESSFNEPEKVSLQYLEISVPQIAKKISVTDEEIKEAFDKELPNFKTDPELTVAHILIQPGKNTADGEEKVAQVQAKLNAGEAFEGLVKVFSDDLGSKEIGGEIGVIPEIFADDAKKTVETLNEGQVSGPIKSSEGTHFVKVLKKTQPVAPTFETRKEALAQSVANDKAVEQFTHQLKQLEDVTFNKSDLKVAAETLGLSIQETELFSKQGAAGVAGEAAVLEAAFAQDVLEQGMISKVLELPNERAVVIRLKERVPSHVKPLAQVRTVVVDAIVKQKTAAQLQVLADGVVAKLRSGNSPEAVAKEAGYKFAAFEKQDRFKSTADREILQFAFGMVRPAATPQLESFATLSGGQVVVILAEAIDGAIADIDAQQFAGIKSQISQQKSSGDLEAFMAAHSAAAKIKY